MMTVSESDTVIVTTDGRARLDVQKLFEKSHVKQALKEMQDKIQKVSHATDSLLEKKPVDRKE
jgi:two-component sensor histidine kinase